MSKKDFDLLTINLKELIRPSGFGSLYDLENPLRGPNGSLDGRPGSVNLSQQQGQNQDARTLDKPKKSVRFSSENLYSEPTLLPLEHDSSLDESENTAVFTAVNRNDITYLDESEDNLDAMLSSSSSCTALPAGPRLGDGPALRLDAESKDDIVYHHSTQPSPVVPAPAATAAPPPSASSLRMTSAEALQIGMILAEQERRFGTNMYISLQPEDEPKIDKYIGRGYTTEEAILRIFEKKYMTKEELVALGRSISLDEVIAFLISGMTKIILSMSFFKS